jgi:hypothetical protein
MPALFGTKSQKAGNTGIFRWRSYVLATLLLGYVATGKRSHIKLPPSTSGRLGRVDIVDAITVSIRARSIERAPFDWLEKDMQGG